MFVVTGLHTKRRPSINSVKLSSTIRRQGVKRFGQLRATSHSYRRLPAKLAISSSPQAATYVLETRMARKDDGLDVADRNMVDRRFLINVSPGLVAPPRVRKFIPKPLILVERMKARQLLLDTPPPAASESRRSLSLLRSTPFSAHVTPPTRRIPTCSTLSPDSPLSSIVSVQMPSKNDVVLDSRFRIMPPRARRLSVNAPGDCSSSTDTFVADSPCCIKQVSYKVLPLVAASDATDVRFDIEPEFGKRAPPRAGVPPLDGSVDFMHRTSQSTDTFNPFVTSTPFGSVVTGVQSPMSFVTSNVYPPRLRGRALNRSESFEIASPTSQTTFPFNTPQDAYVVRLPGSGSVASKSPLDHKRFSNRDTSPSPTLVLDGVFALPRSPSTLVPRKPLSGGFARPRKPTSRQPLSDITNAPTAIVPFELRTATASPTSPYTPPGPESPRSKLAHVLATRVEPRTTRRTRTHGRVPPLVRGVEASNDLRTRCEIEGLRARGVVGLGRGAGGDGGGKGTIERMSLASVGMVARLRARWEAGTAARFGGVDDCA